MRCQKRNKNRLKSIEIQTEGWKDKSIRRWRGQEKTPNSHEKTNKK